MPRRQRPYNPNAAVHALALAHLDLADKIAGNFARRTAHPFDDLRQIAVIGLLKRRPALMALAAVRIGPMPAPTPKGKLPTTCGTTALRSRCRLPGGSPLPVVRSCCGRGYRPMQFRIG